MFATSARKSARAPFIRLRPFPILTGDAGSDARRNVPRCAYAPGGGAPRRCPALPLRGGPAGSRKGVPVSSPLIRYLRRAPLLGALAGAAVLAAPPAEAVTVEPWVHTDGTAFVDGAGRPVLLRGVDVKAGVGKGGSASPRSARTSFASPRPGAGSSPTRRETAATSMTRPSFAASTPRSPGTRSTG